MRPPLCHSVERKSTTLPAGITSGTDSASVGSLSPQRCEPGTMFVPPLSAVNASSAQMAATDVCARGRGNGTNWSSKWKGWGVSPGRMSMACV